ncbi:ATP-binding cassette domain-containing protein [Sinorhizobium sp. BG8]|uniref:ATP-binding cassette domain-containing protein n=1 Tax=Sinorhizobium sp. BG8 TaxID=2613773 RepID=UPI00193EBC8E|nr:ATP-binding cassette domain-containing protein [Sinorhizobium sp. BG8]QRM54107.1 ATP-binding cassette domain-containing protein [Sinorhizobium sp. BG8]
MTVLAKTGVDHGADLKLTFSTEGVSFSAGGKVLLHPADISFKPGEVSALVGHNGSGKSTLLKLLARQLEPETGTVRFAGEPAGRWNARAFARAVAYLPQDAPAAPGMTARELVACGRYPWHGALGRFTEKDREKVEEALRLTHVEHLADRLVDTLSGGERQRVWIAMLVAQDSRCLLLDEPTSALDVAHQIEVLGLVRSLSHAKGLSVVVVLHDINMAARFCDRIFALKGGRFIAEGEPGELMNAATLAHIYGIDMDVVPHPGSGAPIAYVV